MTHIFHFCASAGLWKSMAFEILTVSRSIGMRLFCLRLLLSSVCMLSTSRTSRFFAQGLPLMKTVKASLSPRMAASSNSSRSTQQQRALPTVEQLLDRDGKRIPRASLSTFLITSAIVPVWATVILPLSLAYQAGAATVRAMAKNSNVPHRSASKLLDSGYVVDPSQIVERSKRKYDIVVLGATGFTGYLAVRHLALTYGAPSSKSVQWAIAGRSRDKLESVRQRLADELGNEKLLTVDIIECDTSVPSTLPKLVEQTRVVATTAGPYTLYGSSVVEFCAKFGTHYVDITGEVDWVKAMLCQWQDTAQRTGSRIIPFCGHDSVPWDISYMKLQQALRTEYDDKLKTVTFWNLGLNQAPGGTFATIINGLTGDSIKPPKMDFDPFLRRPDGSKSEYVCKADLPSFPSQAKNSSVGLPSSGSKPWASPFIMAVVNSQVVRWSHALLGQGGRSATYREASLDPDFKTAFVNYVGLVMAGSMLFNPITLSLVKKKIIPKPGEGPSMERMEKKHFLCVKGEAIGENGNKAESIFYLDRDAGCLETSRMLVEAGLSLALQEKDLPASDGGFQSTAFGLGDVLLQRLLQTNPATVFETQVFPASSVRSKL